jgi:hypothetical protein
MDHGTARGERTKHVSSRRAGDVKARFGGRTFTVRYHRRREIVEAFAPEFRFAGMRGIGVFVPPSAAEPWISAHPRLLSALERMDQIDVSPARDVRRSRALRVRAHRESSVTALSGGAAVS